MLSHRAGLACLEICTTGSLDGGAHPRWLSRRSEMAHIGGEGGVEIEVGQAEGLTRHQTWLQDRG